MTVWEVGHIRRYLKLNQGIKVAPWFSKTGDFKRSRIESKWGPHLSTTWRPRRKSVFWEPGRGPPAEPELLVPCSQTSSRQHYEKINVCCLSHSVPDIFVIAAWTDEDIDSTPFSMCLVGIGWILSPVSSLLWGDHKSCWLWPNSRTQVAGRNTVMTEESLSIIPSFQPRLTHLFRSLLLLTHLTIHTSKHAEFTNSLYSALPHRWTGLQGKQSWAISPGLSSVCCPHSWQQVVDGE